VLSFLVDGDAAADASDALRICLLDDGAHRCPWPEWHPAPAPAAAPLALQTWTPITESAADPSERHRCDRLLTAAAAETDRREQVLSKQLSDRCARLVQDGTDDRFTESLEYYITQRVKRAYLRLNAHNLRERLDEVRRVGRALSRCLRAPDPSVSADWSPPRSPGVSVDNDLSNPNALCTPQIEDYELMD
jgi:hypothetical protein